MSAAIESTSAIDVEAYQHGTKVVPKLDQIGGYRTYSEGESTRIKEWKKSLIEIYERFGFSPLENRPVERVQNLLHKGGLGKEIYGLCRAQNGLQVDVALPFDRTVPLALWIVERSNELAFPFKRWDIDYSFRGEHANLGANRYRGFIQADIDVIDRNMGSRVQADAECIATTILALRKLEIPPFQMSINHIKIAKAIIRAVGIPEDKIQGVLQCIDKLDKKTSREVAQMIRELVPTFEEGKEHILVNRFNYKGTLREFTLEKSWGNEVSTALAELQDLFNLVKLMGVKEDEVVFNLGMVRGLDYYTGVVCETFFIDQELSKYGSIASGGRYDGLVDSFTERQTNLQGVGVSIGLTRLFGVLTQKKLINTRRKGNSQVFVGFRTVEQLSGAVEAASVLRAKGLNVDLYAGGKKTVGQLEYANRKTIPHALMVMDKNAFVVKNMLDAADLKGVEVKSIAEAVGLLSKRVFNSKKE